MIRVHKDDYDDLGSEVIEYYTSNEVKGEKYIARIEKTKE